ncbi:glycoside hydrolase family 15 protein [Rothia amarae]|uniref:glycoside hydrolase family 15 protein n=1 Tax=Rothia amarae TaxID=169480 RepID=UPI0031DB367E
MASFIEDYALLSDMNTAALVSRAGSIDWFCAPRFDSGAVFASLLGDRENGRWLLAPLESVNPSPVEEVRTERSYRENTFILQTVWHVGEASVRVTDFMPLAGGTAIVRSVEGLTGEVTMLQELNMRFDSGKTTPWVTQYDGPADSTGAVDVSQSMLVGMAGPHALVFRGDTIPEGQYGNHTDTFTVSAGQNYVFSLNYFASNHNPPAPIDYSTAITYTTAQWTEWSDLYVPPAIAEATENEISATRTVPNEGISAESTTSSSIGLPSTNREGEAITNTQLPEIDLATYHELAQTAMHPIVPSTPEQIQTQNDESYREARLRSLLVLRALISRETGGLVAAATTSLPETVGGRRNWDFRFSWLRDVAMAMEVTLAHGHERETAQLRNWIMRAVANSPYNLHSVYGVAGEKDDLERRLALPGYENSQPVRAGNGSDDRFQGDALGQVLVTFAHLRENGVGEDQLSWSLQKALLNSASERIGQPDQSMWEIKGDPHVFTHSQAMLWAAFNAGISAVQEHGLDGDVELWAQCRDRLAEDILSHGFNTELNSFVQTYGGTHVDASLLQLAQIGMVTWDDPRMMGTVARIERELQHESGMIYRYINVRGFDGFEDQDNLHFAASLWLAEHYIRSGREADGRALLDTVLSAANDLGLMSSEYSFVENRQTGNFPHTLAHIALVRAVQALGI